MKEKLFLISLILSGFLFSCNTDKNDVRPKKIFLILIDLSQSVKNPTIIKSFKSDYRPIIDKLQPGDVIVAGLITESSITEHTVPVKMEFPEFTASTDNDLYRNAEKAEFYKKLATIKDSLLNILDTALLANNRKVMKTDIFSSLLWAEKVFNNYPGKVKILIVMSDMIECSNMINFENENLTSKRIKQILNTKKTVNGLPVLNEVKVYITGVNARDAERFEKIQNFWIEYFLACRAELDKANYGATLITFNE